jgi:hypothetical protein
LEHFQQEAEEFGWALGAAVGAAYAVKRDGFVDYCFGWTSEVSVRESSEFQVVQSPFFQPTGQRETVFLPIQRIVDPRPRDFLNQVLRVRPVDCSDAISRKQSAQLDASVERVPRMKEDKEGQLA